MTKTYSKEAEYVTVWARAQRNRRASEVIHIARIRLFTDIHPVRQAGSKEDVG